LRLGRIVDLNTVRIDPFHQTPHDWNYPSGRRRRADAVNKIHHMMSIFYIRFVDGDQCT